jgi:hypothetical protein
VPFDPRLIHPDDAPEDACGELDLPDDLLELAAQLQDDALYLAARYPAKVAVEPLLAEVTAVNVHAPTPSRRHWLVAGGSIAAALTIAVALAYRPPTEPREAALPVNNVASVSIASTNPPGDEVHVSTPINKPAGPRIERLPWAPVPAIGEVTGPELEGLLDLWQNDEHPAETRISI